MRTTLTIDDEVYRQTKSLAAVTGRSVGSVVERPPVALSPAQHEAAAVRPLPVSAGAPLSGVDMDDSAALLDVMGSG